MSQTRAKTVLESLNALLKQASAKRAEDDMGSSDTTHPSKSVDDGTQPASEGARSAENTSDVKSQIGPNSTDNAKPENMENKSVNPLTTASAVGEDPSVETSSVKDKPEDDDTSHPASAAFGEKYSRARAASEVVKSANMVLTKLAALTIKAEQPTPAKAAAAPTPAPQPVTTPDTNKDVEMGKAAAEAVISQANSQPNVDAINSVVFQVVKEASDDADRLISFYAGLADEAKKASAPKPAPAKPKTSISKLAKAIASEVIKNTRKKAEDMPQMPDDKPSEKTEDSADKLAGGDGDGDEGKPSGGMPTQDDENAGVSLGGLDEAQLMELLKQLLPLLQGGGGGMPSGADAAGGGAPAMPADAGMPAGLPAGAGADAPPTM